MTIVFLALLMVVIYCVAPLIPPAAMLIRWLWRTCPELLTALVADALLSRLPAVVRVAGVVLATVVVSAWRRGWWRYDQNHASTNEQVTMVGQTTGGSTVSSSQFPKAYLNEPSKAGPASQPSSQASQPSSTLPQASVSQQPGRSKQEAPPLPACAKFYCFIDGFEVRDLERMDYELGQEELKKRTGMTCSDLILRPGSGKRYPKPDAFDEVIGLERAKDDLTDTMQIIFGNNEAYQRYKVKPIKGILLYGPPRCGKTSFARAAAKRFGIGFIVVNASAAVDPHPGWTGKNIEGIFKFAKWKKPCIIFFDEIDAIAQKRTSTAGVTESISTLLACFDGFAGNDGVVVIAATNRKDMLDEAILQAGRFDKLIEVGLPDLQARERIFSLYLKDRPNDIDTDTVRQLAGCSDGMSPAEIEEIVNEAARRAAKSSELITRDLILAAMRKGDAVQTVEEVWKEIDSMVGLDRVKQFLHEVENIVNANRVRIEKGLQPLKPGYHMAFLGPPGTGKTTAARLAAKLLAYLNVLREPKCIETDRSGLVGQFVGETAQKTKTVLESAVGGVLFIDEAYSLARGGGSGQDFGAEALDTIVKYMEDHRQNIVIIFAGYDREMQALFALNSGLESRIDFTCDFPGYSPEELVEIARLEAQKSDFTLSPDADAALLEIFRRPADGNGRYARKLVELAIRKAISNGRVDRLEAEDFGVLVA